MRLAVLLALGLPACAFQVGPVILDEGTGGDSALSADFADASAPDLARPLDLAMPDLATRDLVAPPDFTPPPDLVVPIDLVPPPPLVTLQLDARSPALYKTLAQPLLADVPGATQGHYHFDESGTGALIDYTAKSANLQPVNVTFVGGRGRFTQIPAANGGGFTRVATEMSGGTGFVDDAGRFDVTSSDFTIEAWFKLTPDYAVTSTSGCDPIAAKGITPAGYVLCVLPGGRLRMQVAWSGGVKTVDSAVAFNDGAWHYGTFAFVLSRASAAGLFVDGANLTPAQNDLLLPANQSLSNQGEFTIGGAGNGSVFRGALAELAFHLGSALTLAANQANYRAFALPMTVPNLAPQASYARAGTLCTVVGSDAMLGDRVACYGGGGGVGAPASQVAIATNPAANNGDNPDRLGVATTPGGANFANTSEHINAWSVNVQSLMVDAAVSPRGDQTAEVIGMPAGGYAISINSAFNGNGYATFSVWLRGHNNGDYTFMRLTTGNGSEFKHCLARLSTQWQRYTCTQQFAANPADSEIGIDGYVVMGDPVAPMAMVSFDIWGAQLERSPVATAYLPNIASGTSVTRGPSQLSVNNSPALFLGATTGQLAVGFTGDPAMIDGSYLFDTGPGLDDRHYLRRDPNMILTGEVLDTFGKGAADSVMTAANVGWASQHTIGLGWSSAVPIQGMGHTSLALDGVTSYGRIAAGYSPSTPPTLYLGSDQGLMNQPSGTLHSVTIWNKP